jgi:tetratricopeptide (TPR) repeat protein
VNREQSLFLLCGFAFGLLVGAGVYRAFIEQPDLVAATPAGSTSQPNGATTSAAADSGAPMLAEIGALRRRLEEDPRDFAALVRLANLYHDASMFDEAIGYYERALEIQPTMPDLLTDLGICYRAKQEYERALELFDRALEIDPNHWQSLFNIVIVAGFDLGRYDRADQALQRMEGLDPQPPRIGELRQALEQRRARANGGAEG